MFIGTVSILHSIRIFSRFIRTACKKLILHDLPEEAEVGLVMFNQEAEISHSIGILQY